VFPVYEIGPDGHCACGAKRKTDGGAGCASGKHPRIQTWQRAATRDISYAAKWWEKWPNANVGVATGANSGLVVIDLDIKPARGDKPAVDGVHSLEALEGRFGPLPLTLRSQTGRGGYHLFFRYPEGVERVGNSVEVIAPGIDVRADGGYVVVPPSNHESGKTYVWLNQHPPADMPPWLLARVLGAKTKSTASKSPRVLKNGPRRFSDGGRNDALTSLAGSMRKRGMPVEAIQAALRATNNIQCVPPLEDDEVDKIAASVSRYEPSDLDAELAAAAATVGDAWYNRLARNTQEKPLASLANIAIAINGHKDLCDVFRWNARAQSVYVVREPPWHRDQLLPRPSSENDMLELAFFLGELWGTSIALRDTRDAISGVAARTPFDPVKDYLESLVWDGVRRLPTWLQTYCDVEDSEHVRLVGERWLLSAVARTFKPGCKVDHILLLEGAQGDGKSTVAQVLAVKPHDWYTDDISDFGTVKAAEQLQGKWVVELAELAAIRSRDANTTKSFITRNADNFRTPYAQTTTVRPRMCVFIGTTNPGAHLVDPTGARRFWLVKTRGLCDTTKLAADRDQLWAEAVHMFAQGAPWYPDRTEAELHAEAAEAAQVEDLWQTIVERLLEERAAVTLDHVRSHLEIPLSDTPRHSRQLSDLMRRCGWTPLNKKMKGGRTERLWHPDGREPSREQAEAAVASSPKHSRKLG